MTKFAIRLISLALAFLLVLSVALISNRKVSDNAPNLPFVGKEVNDSSFSVAVLITETNCPLMAQPIPMWPKVFAGTGTIRRISGGFFPGTQGLVGSEDGSNLVSVHGPRKQTVLMHSLRLDEIEGVVGADINAAAVTRIEIDGSSIPSYLVTDYDRPSVTLVDKSFTSFKTLQLPNHFRSLVGIGTIQDKIAILPSRSAQIVGFLSVGNDPSLQIIPVELDEEAFTTAVPYGVAVVEGCIILNYREDGALAIGTVTKAGVISTQVLDSDLEYPQSIAAHRDKLFVIETGVHSILVYDFASWQRYRFLLPKGVFRGIAVTQTGEVFISGEVFEESEKGLVHFTSVLNENKVGIYRVVGLEDLK